MLEKIIIKNVNSIKEVEIDFRKGSYKYGEDNIIGDCVNPIALYGHNGSGKTSFFNAISSFIQLMISPMEALSPFIVNNFLYEKYFSKSGKKNENDIIGSICMDYSLNENKYQYYVSTSRLNYINNEYLICNNKTIFERGKSNYKYKDKKYVFDTLSNMIPTIRRLASLEINDLNIQESYSYLSSFTFLSLPYINRGFFVTSKLFNNISVYDLLVNQSDKVKEILKTYKEFPLFSIEKKNTVTSINDPLSQYSMRIYDGDFEGTLPLAMISSGMRNQSILLSILLTMPENSVIFVDELEQALHPSTIKSFLEIVKKRKMQLVFSSHNTFILQMLRPDQIYFAKWEKGFSSFSRLSKIYPNIREINNIEKMYLSSVFDNAINNG